MSPRVRILLFAAISAALIAAAFLIGHRGFSPATALPPSADGLPLPRSGPRPAHSHSQPQDPSGALARSARRFLTAFLRYEVGDRESSIARDLRRTSTHPFASELLGRAPSRSGHAEPATATLSRLDFAQVSSDPPLFSVSATALRRSGPEQVSFVFELRGGRWLASAPGE